LVGIETDASWAAADIDFEVAKASGLDYKAMVNYDNSALAISSLGASSYLPVDPGLFAGVEALKINSSESQANTSLILHIRAVS
jgi:hypothetical protein